MFQTLKNAWKTQELKTKLLFTLLIVILYRLGSAIPVPYVNVLAKEAMADYWSGGNILSFVNLLTGGALGQGTLFALGVSPYITASIVMQLLSIAIPYFEKKSKEGEEGKKIINAWTRGVTVVLAVITSIGYVMMLDSYGMLLKEANVFVYFVMVACYCAGASLVMWLAEKINESGILDIKNGRHPVVEKMTNNVDKQIELLKNLTFTPTDFYGFDVAQISVGGIALSNLKETNFYNQITDVIEMQSEAGAAGAMHGALLSIPSTITKKADNTHTYEPNENMID